MNKPQKKRILKRPKTLQFATIQYAKELPLILNFNTKAPVGFVTLEKTIDDYLVNPLGVYKEHKTHFANMQLNVAGKILESKGKVITKFQIMAINVTL